MPRVVGRFEFLMLINKRNVWSRITEKTQLDLSRIHWFQICVCWYEKDNSWQPTFYNFKVLDNCLCLCILSIFINTGINICLLFHFKLHNALSFIYFVYACLYSALFILHKTVCLWGLMKFFSKLLILISIASLQWTRDEWGALIYFLSSWFKLI